MAKHPELIRGQIFRDPAVSAWKNEFAARPGGKELAEKVQSGDHVIFWGMKRAFRLARDGHTMLDKWREQGIYLHFVREAIDLTTAGRARHRLTAGRCIRPAGCTCARRDCRNKGLRDWPPS